MQRSPSIRPKKSLGQHFLKDPFYLAKIIDAARIGPADRVLEIGPGLGDLTRLLAARAERVLALELDDRLIGVLRNDFAGSRNVEIVHGDALTFDYGSLAGPWKVVANLPYYISTPLVPQMIGHRGRFSPLTVMLQKEAAERIAAPPGGKEYGFLSVLVQLYTDPRMEFSVPPGAFSPPPVRSYLGGKGLGSYLLLKENPPHIDPFSPKNRLIFTLGPLADTPFYGSSRYAVFTKSPQTGIYCESYSGGKITLPLSRTGYVAIIIEGKSNDPIFLEISDKEVIFHPVLSLWGKDTYKAEEAILKKVGKDSGALVIGPAGENLVKFAVIESEHWRSLGRAGIGAVLGSKKLKGLAFHGKKRRELADPSSLKKLAKEFKERVKDNSTVAIYKKYGTPMLVSIMNTEQPGEPVRRRGTFHPRSVAL